MLLYIIVYYVYLYPKNLAEHLNYLNPNFLQREVEDMLAIRSISGDVFNSEADELMQETNMKQVNISGNVEFSYFDKF